MRRCPSRTLANLFPAPGRPSEPYRMIELRLLGTVALRREDGGSLQAVAVQPKRLALLSYLAAARPRGPHRRDVLLGLLWPELDTDRARAALSKALHHLRLSLGATAIVSHGEEAIELDASAVRSDLERFERNLEENRAEEALALYVGDLLHGFFLSDAPEFERWLDGERARLRARAANAAAELAEQAERTGHQAAAVTWSRRALELAGDERALRRLMQILDAAGDGAGALAAHEVFAARLRRELDVEPSPETQQLAASIRTRAADTASTSARRPPRRSAPAGTVVAAAPAEDAPAPEAPPAPAPRRPAIRRTALVLVAAGTVALILAVVALRGRGSDPVLEPRRVLVLPFDNRTLDPALEPVGRMAADWIIDGVSRMGGFEVVPSSAVWTAQAGANATGAGEADALRRVARETGAGTVLSGSYYIDGGRILIQARAHDAATGRVLRPIGGISASPDSVIEGIDRLRTRVLAALAPVGDTVYHLRAAAPPPTYDAYREYITAMGAFVGGDPAVALRHYERAAAADSAWAMPRIAAAIMHMNLGRLAAGDSIIAPLHAERDRLGPLERGTVDMVLGMLQGDYAYAYQAMVELARIAPGTINEYMVAELARKLNRPAEALDVLLQMGAERGELRGWRGYWRETAWSHHMLSRHSAELTEARRARTLYPHEPFSLALEVHAHAALGRVAEVRARIDERSASPTATAPAAGELAGIAVRELMWHGHDEGAAEIAAHAVAWYENQPATARNSAAWRMRYATALANAERLQEAAVLQRALHRERPDDPIIAAGLGLTLARLGQRDEALALSDFAGSYTAPRGRAGIINVLYGEHHLLRAAIAAQLGDPATAVRLLRDAESDGLQFSPLVLCNPDLAPLRGDPGFEAWRRPRTLPGS
jgi:DNA-binding SARP family transcriptional activator/TolB-like protein